MCFLFLSLRWSPTKIAGAGILFVGGGIGGTILYAKWDSHFRKNVEKTIPYSDKLFEMVLGSPPYTVPLPKKPVRVLSTMSVYPRECFEKQVVFILKIFCRVYVFIFLKIEVILRRAGFLSLWSPISILL